MRIRQLTIRNLNSLRLTTSIDFSQPPLANTGLFAITGDTGAGKTTILDAITLALYGSIPRKSDPREAMSYGSSDSLAEVEFEHGGRRFLAHWALRRSRGKTDGKIQTPERSLAEWNEDKQEWVILAEKVKEVDQLVETFTGLDYDRFRRSVLLAQGDFAAFLNADERSRSELLEKITGTEVYSELSKAAFVRFRKEEEALKAIQLEMSNLQVLPEEKVQDLQALLQKSKMEADKAAGQIGSLDEQIRLFDKNRQLEEQLNSLLEEKDTLAARRLQAAPEIEKLRRFERLKPWQKQLAIYNDLELRRREAADQLVLLSGQQAEVAEKLALVEQELQEQQENLAQQRENYQQKLPLWRRAQDMDIQIREKNHHYQEKYAELAETIISIEDTRSQTTELNHRLEQIQTAANENQAWLATHQPLESLPEKYPLLERSVKEYLQLELQSNHFLKDQEKLTQELKLLERELALHHARMESLMADHAEKEKAFQEMAAPAFLLNRTELLGHFSREIENLTSKKGQLEELSRLDREYRQLLQEQLQSEQQLQSLRTEDEGISKSLISLLEEMDDLAATVQYRQSVYEQQQLIANYEQDRAKLKPGEPCPLCFSTEHPFHTHQITPYADRARQELDKAKQKLESVYARQRVLVDRHKEIGLLIDQLQGNDGDSISGRIGDTLRKVTEAEKAFSRLAQPWQDLNWQSGELETLLAQTIGQVQQKRQALEKLLELDKDLTAIQQERQNLTEKANSIQLGYTRIQERLNTAAEQLQEARQKWTAEKETIQHQLKSLGWPASAVISEQLATELKKSRDLYQEKLDQSHRLERQAELTRQDLESRSRLLQQLDARRTTLDQQASRQSEELEHLKAGRYQLLQEADPALEQATAEAVLTKQETQLAHLREAAELARRQKDALDGRRQQSQRTYEGLCKNRDDHAAILEKAASEHHLGGIADLQQAMLSPETESEIRTLLDDLQRQEAEHTRLLKEKHQEQSNLREQLQLLPQEEALRSAFHSLVQNEKGLQQQIGMITLQLQQNEQKQTESVQLNLKLTAQKKEFQRWAKLNDIIGSADGKKFRVFAQGLTLTRLTRLANAHLRQLSGRYVIHKKDDQELGLEIIDTFQANNTRSTNTLSGGESFLVSLALALGLSDLAGGKTSIQSLFIDEGFGTLDDNSLDLALSTLENLQATGKTIGVISHVKELKERIGVQIQVRKKAEGFSEIEIVD